MKNRKTILVAFMLVACMVIGVGYANVATHLNIQGGATVSVDGAQSAFATNIAFTAVDTGNEANAKLFGTASIGDGKTADFSVTGLTAGGTSAELIYTISNTGDLAANVEVDATNTTNNNEDYFEVETEWVDGDETLEASGGTAKIKVIITLKQTPASSTAPTTAQFNIRLIATAITPEP